MEVLLPVLLPVLLLTTELVVAAGGFVEPLDGILEGFGSLFPMFNTRAIFCIKFDSSKNDPAET